MAYVNPSESDSQTINDNGALSKRQAQEDYYAAKSEGGIDAEIYASRHPQRPTIRDGFRRISGMSRSGAMDPRTRSRLDQDERDGLIEVQRDGYGDAVAYRIPTR